MGSQTRALQAMASSRPPPSVGPRTAATVGLSPASRSATNIRFVSAKPSFGMAGAGAAAPGCFFFWALPNCEMSNPAEKFLPAPVTTMAFTAGSCCASASFRAASISTAEGRGFWSAPWLPVCRRGAVAEVVEARAR